MKDYGQTGVDIQTAMVLRAKANPDRVRRPKSILWNGQNVWTTYEIVVPREGRFTIEFLSEARQPPQGVDVKAEGGQIILAGGEAVQTLRTWHDERFESVVEYPYQSEAGLLKVWNVYLRSWPDGRVSEEKWTGNAGCLVDDKSDGGLVFRCSDGGAKVPDFAQLVFRLSITA